MQTISLDISRKHSVPPIYAKQSEVGRKFLAVITDNGVPYNIPDNALLSVWYEGDTDAGNYSSIEEKSAFSIDGNKVIVELVAQMLLKPGSGDLCLSVTHGDGGETNTWNIPYCVEYKPGAGSAVPTEYYTALTEAGAQAAQYSTEAKAAATAAQEAVAGYVKADGTVPLSGHLSMGGNKITNLADPKNDEDAVNLRTIAALSKILVPVGYIFYWNPVANNDIDLSTADKVRDHFGFGVWEQIKDRFLLSAGDDFAVGEIGGESTHTLTIEEMPAHRHQIVNAEGAPVNYNSSGATGEGNNGISTGAPWDNMWTQYVGNNKPYSIMPPYLAVYVWKRIA